MPIKLSYGLPLSVEFLSQPSAVVSIISVQVRDINEANTERIKHFWEQWASCHPDSSLQVLQMDKVKDTQKCDYYALNAIKVKWMPGFNEPNFDLIVTTLPIEFCFLETSIKRLRQDLIEYQMQIDTYLGM